MEDLNTTTESEQMYLVTIARLSEVAEECPIPIAKVAEILEVTPISANQMIHNLKQSNLITYTPYKGVEFTEFGWQTASRLLRIRRLWEVFLVEYLHYPPGDAEILACRLEHAIPEETADRLAGFLGWPQVSPLGMPIPQGDGEYTLPPGVPLAGLPAGTNGAVAAILAGEAEKTFLNQAGINIGCQFQILAGLQNEACLVKWGGEVLVTLDAELARKIYVNPES